MWWTNLFKDMSSTSFFNFSFLPAYTGYFLQGMAYTLLLAVVSVALAVIPALLLALMRLSKKKAIQCVSGAYIAVFRSTPLLVQLSIIYFGLFTAISIPRITIWGFVDLSRFIPGVVALALNSSAYVAEIFRAGIQSIDNGQMEAGRSLGMSWAQTMRYVIMPQAFKRIIPPLGNEFIAMLKDSSLVSVIGFEELTRRGQLIIARTYASFEIWMAVAVIYLIMTFTVARLVGMLERRYDTK